MIQIIDGNASELLQCCRYYQQLKHKFKNNHSSSPLPSSLSSSTSLIIMSLTSTTPLLLFLFILACFLPCNLSAVASLSISTELPPLQSDEQPQITNYPIIINPSQPYIHYTDYLEPQPEIYTRYCRFHNGELHENVVATFATSVHTGQSNDGKGENQNGFSGIDYGQFVYVQRYGIIYQLWRNALSAFKFTHNPSTLQSSLQFIEKLDLLPSHQSSTNGCGIQLALSKDQQYLYILACDRIIRMSMKNSLASISVVSKNSEMFYGSKAVSGQDVIVWASYSEGVRVYAVGADHNLTLLQTIPAQFNPSTSQPQKIMDMSLTSSHLYLLGHSSTIFIYEQIGSGNFQQIAQISLASLCSSSCVHREILVHDGNIYVSSVAEGQEFISELLVKEMKEVMLIRYFKGRRNYIGMSITDGKLMVIYQHAITIFERNRDPRTIRRLMNGVSTTHFEELKHITRIGTALFIKTTASGSFVVKLSLTRPSVQCQFPATSSQAIDQFLTVNLTRLCKQTSLPLSSLSTLQTCLGYDALTFSFLKQEKQYHIFAVIAISIFCIAVVGILVIWRRGKIHVIESIVNEINKIKKKNMEINDRRRIEFVEQRAVARETNWNDLHESFSEDQEPQIVNQNLFSIDEKPKAQIQLQPIEKQKQQQSKKQQSKQKQKQRQDQNEAELHAQQQLHEDDDENYAQGTERNMVYNTKADSN